MVSSDCWPSSKHVFPATGDILLFCYPTTWHHHLLATPSGLWQIATGAHYISTWVSAAVHHPLACHQGPSSAVQCPPAYQPPSSSPHHLTFSKCWCTLHQHMGQHWCSPSAHLPSSAAHHTAPPCLCWPALPACHPPLPHLLSPSLSVVTLAAVSGQHHHLEVVAPPHLAALSLPPRHAVPPCPYWPVSPACHPLLPLSLWPSPSVVTLRLCSPRPLQLPPLPLSVADTVASRLSPLT